MKKCVLVLAAAMMPLVAQAKQEIRVKDGDTVKVVLSSMDPTRIVVKQGRVDKVVGPKGALDIQADKERGEIFVKPIPGSAQSVTFFVRDDSGSTYTLIATQQQIPGDTIELVSSTPRKATGRGAEYRATPYVERVKRLIKAMALNENLDGYGEEEQSRPVPLWKETEITLAKTYTTHDLYGEVYVITNISNDTLKFHEREFMEFGERVQAVALERLNVRPGEATFLYVVRRSPDAPVEVR